MRAVPQLIEAPGQFGRLLLSIAENPKSALLLPQKDFLNPLFDTYPILIKLAKGDLLNQLSLPGGRELQAEGLNYRPGSRPNDTLLRFGIEEYRRNGYYNR